MKNHLSLTLAIFTTLMLVACANSSPDVIQRSEAQRMAPVEDGVILSVRSVVIDGSQTGVGAGVGGAVGAIGGYSASGVPREAQALGVLAGVAGAVTGNAIERMSTRDDAVEILIQLKGGERRSIVQTKGSDVLAAGDQVVIVTSGGKARIVKFPNPNPNR